MGPLSSYQVILPMGDTVLRSLAEMTAFANCSDVANLAYWVTGTEGSNSFPLRHRVLLRLRFGER